MHPTHAAAVVLATLTTLALLRIAPDAEGTQPNSAPSPQATRPARATLLYAHPPRSPAGPPPPDATTTHTRPARPSAPTPTGDLEVRFLDVGQGDATLLLAPDATMLIDTGRHDRTDVADHLLAAGIARLDVVAITHPHADHLGQLDRILHTLTVAEVWWPPATHTTATYDRALAALETTGTAFAEPRAGDVTTVGSLLIEVANPEPFTATHDPHDSGLVLRITYGQVTFLFTGDAEAPTEQRLLDRHPHLLPADVYQVGHHGSATSTTPAFLTAVNPTVAIYSAGATNPYGHPHPEVAHQQPTRRRRHRPVRHRHPRHHHRHHQPDRHTRT